MELPAFRSFKQALGMDTADGDAASSSRQPSPERDMAPASRPHRSGSNSSSASNSSSGSRRSHREDGSHRRESSNRRGRRTRQAPTTTTAVNLPVDRDFVPLHDDTNSSQQDECERPGSPDRERDEMRKEVICMIFDLPKSTTFYPDSSCAIAATFAMHGRMYPTSSHLCFYSNVFGRERKIRLPYASITSVTKTTTLVFQLALRITTTTDEDYTFTSFWGDNRDRCYELILQIQAQVLGRSVATTARSGGDDHTVRDSDGSVNDNHESGPVEPEPDREGVEQESEPEASGEQGDSRARAPGTDAGTSPPDCLADDRASRLPRVVSDQEVATAAPRDDSMTLLLEDTFPLSVDAFVEMFVLDDASFGLDEFQRRNGSTEIQCKPWTVPPPPATPSPTMSSTPDRMREMHFRVPIEAAFGPKSTLVDALQCYKCCENNVRVVETSTRLVDIPYGDYFSVESRWTIAPHATEANACVMAVELKIVFSKSTIWKSTIEGRGVTENKENWMKWVEMAKEHLTRANPPSRVPSTGEEGDTNRLRRQASRDERSPSPRTRSLRRQLTSGRGANASRISVRTIFPWVVIVVLVALVLRLHWAIERMEQSLSSTTQHVVAMQEQLQLLTAATNAASVCSPPR